jgi:drug/metabolite transporter (DMT)-like permease
MDTQELKSDTLLLITAIIWGIAFVAQRVGMDYVGPFTYNGVRFALGTVSILPLLFVSRKEPAAATFFQADPGLKMVVLGGTLTGVLLFMGASFQQVGLVYTTAGKAGFITGLYVVIVPILALFWKRATHIGTWLGASLAAVGMYLLSVTERFTVSYGDLLVFISAFFWAGQVIVIGWLSPKIQSVKLAFYQFLACSILSLLVAGIIEDIVWIRIVQAGIPILYGGVLSGGVAFTLQVVAQRHTHPAHASILMSLEAVFAAIGGWLLLDESLGLRGSFGCGCMLAGMLLSRLWGLGNSKRRLSGYEKKK